MAERLPYMIPLTCSLQESRKAILS